MVAYDPDVIRGFADDLYRQAAEMVRGAMLAGFLLGGFAGGAVGAMVGPPADEIRGTIAYDPSGVPRAVEGLRSHSTSGGVFGFMFLGIFGALIGRSMARARASALRLQAQTALCQVAIEENTRNTAVRPRRVRADA